MKYTPLLFLFIISNFCSGQDVKITWGKPGSDELQFKKIISIGDGFVKLSLKKDGKKKNALWLLVLTSYDEKLNEIKSETWPGQEDRKAKTIFRLKNNLYLLIGNKTEVYDEIVYSVQRVDPASLQPSGAPVVVGNFYFHSPEILMKELLIYSADSTKILFKGYQDKKPRICPCIKPPITVHVFDEHMTRLFVRRLDDFHHHTLVNTIHLTNNGEVVAYYDGGTSKNSAGPSGITTYFPDGTKNELAIPESTTYFQEFSVYADHENMLLIYGQYRNAPFTWQYGAAGIFTATLDISTNKFTMDKQYPFGKTLVDGLRQDKLAKEDNTIDNFFTPAGVKASEDGSISYLLEYRELPLLEESNFSPAMAFWNWHDIINLRVTKEGESNFTRIPKFQHAWVDRMTSIGSVAVPYKDNILFFYMDWKKNIERDPAKFSVYYKNEFKNLSLVMATIDSKGTLTRKVVVEEFDEAFSPSILYSYAIAGNKILLIGQQSHDPQEATKEVVGVIEIK